MRYGFRVWVGVGLLLAARAVVAQADAKTVPQAGSNRPSFIKATVNLSVPRDLSSPQPGQARVGVYVNGAQMQYNYLPIRSLIMMAYQVKQYQIAGLSMLNDRQYDIVATMPEGSTANDAPMMLRTLLEDRFKLVVHRESKDRPVLALTVKKGGPKLKPSTVDLATMEKTPPPPHGIRIRTAEGPINLVTNTTPHQITSLESTQMSMPALAEMLTNLVHGGNRDTRQAGGAYVNDSDWLPVLDQTGLTGTYEVTVKSSIRWNTVRLRVEGVMLVDTSRPFENDVSPHSGGMTDELDPTLVFSLEDLGLKLEKTKAPVEQLVIDHLEKNPAEN